jgi:glycosyltransferase involved in cell wall biosynthesis
MDKGQPSPISLLTAAGYSRRHLSFASADEFGVQVAQHDLLDATLALTPGHVRFLAGLTPRPISLAGVPRPNDIEAIDDLRARFPTKVTTSKVTPFVVDDGRPVYLAGGPELLSAAEFRQGSPQGFPICSVLHSSNWPGLLFAYMNALLVAEPYDCLVATSKAGRLVIERALEIARNFLTERLPGSYAPPDIRTTLIPLGVDQVYVDGRDRASSRDLLGLDRDAQVLLYLGRLSEQYKADLEPLIGVFSTLVNYPHAVLVIAGQDLEGEYSKSLERLSSSLGCRGRLRILTNFPPFVKPSLYAAADIFISPVDNIQETFGLSILEAMGSGLPVVASDWSGYRDLVVNGVTGLLLPTSWDPAAAAAASLFAPLDGTHRAEHYLAQRTIVDVEALRQALRTLLDDPDLRRSFGAAGKARVREHFTWNTVIPRFYALWEEQHELYTAFESGRIARPWVNYGDLYGHFASFTQTRETAIVCTEPQATLEYLGRYPGRYPSTRMRRETEQMVRRSGLFSVDVAELTSRDHDGLSADAIAWLTKRGFCRLVRSREPDAAVDEPETVARRI